MASEFQLFDGKNLSSLFKDIYENQQNKKKNISELIESLRKLIRNVGEATVIAPIIKDLILIFFSDLKRQMLYYVHLS